MNDSKQRNDALEKLAALIQDIEVAMLTTIRPSGGLHSRPMANVNREFMGDLWFFTGRDDPKNAEIEAQPSVNVSFSAPSQQQYVSVAGKAEILQDEKRAELLWNDSVGAWFPSGTTPSDLSLIRVDVQNAEFWDASSSSMRGLGGLVHQVVSGAPRPVKNESIDWDN